jgi:RsiW-degrading membrane proteinase PrsW (M82 family)
VKKIIKWVLIAVAVVMIYNTPTKAADLSQRIVSAVSTAGERASTFVEAAMS